MAYEVRIAAFEGPFDLLLQLIAGRKLDVHDVDLADITADFIAHLDGIDEFDLETATRFLVVAATLIELKALRLLPQPEQEDLEELLGEARDLLYARLLEYRGVRRAARILEERLDANAGRHGRSAALEARFRHLVPDTPLPIDARGLAALAAVALRPRPEPTIDLHHVQRTYLSIREAAGSLIRWLRRGEAVAFADLVGGRDVGDRIAYFLAVLELYKLDQLDLTQSDLDAPLAVTRRPDAGPPALSLVGADDDDVPVAP